MGSSRRMYLGTSGAGVVVLSEEGGRWAQEANGLEEHDVECISVASDGSAVFAAVEQKGVYASRDHVATWALVLAADPRAAAVAPSDPRRASAGPDPGPGYRGRGTSGRGECPGVDSPEGCPGGLLPLR